MLAENIDDFTTAKLYQHLPKFYSIMYSKKKSHNDLIKHINLIKASPFEILSIIRVSYLTLFTKY